MRVLLITLGSHGDIHPFFALARALMAAGHEAVVLTNPHFGKQAARAGITIEPITDEIDIKEFMQTPGVMDPMKGARVVLRDLTLPAVPKIYQRTLESIDALKPNVCVIHPICLGASWAAEKRSVPVVTVGLAPIMWMNPRDSVVFGPWRSQTPRPIAVRFDSWVGRHIMRFMLDGGLNKARRELGLPKRRDQLIGEFQRPGLNLGLWSSAFRASMEGDPVGSVICGFPWFDDHHDHQIETDELLEFLDDGEAPIVFTMGTAAVHAPGNFYAHAAEAAERLKKRAILLMGRAEYVGALPRLPAGVRAFTYAPFSMLLPRALLTVHHGGIGTTAQALRSGKPTVIVPLAHDQFDNAARAYRMGTSETVHHRRTTTRALQSAIDRVLSDLRYAQTAAKAGAIIQAEDGAAVAVGELARQYGGFTPRMRGFSVLGAEA